MKKFVKANARLIIGIIAVIIVICVCAVACDKDSTANNTENLSQGNITITEGEENSDTQESTDSEVIANDAELKNDADDLSKELEAALKENESLKAENAELKKENSSLEAQINPAVEVIDGVVYCDVDYFLSRTTVKFADDTAALMAISSGTPVVLDDVHAIGQTAGYRDETFELPRKGYNIAVTFDGKEVQIADFSNYHWASSSLFLKSNATTGYKLVETYKCSSMGNFDLLLQCVAVCVENPEAEYGYDFYVAANYNDPNPVVSKPESQPECPKDETDDKPVVNPEVPDEDKDSEHNPLPDDKDDDKESAHNPLPDESDENPNGEIIDTTPNPEDDSNDEGNHNLTDDEDNSNIIEDEEVIDTTINPEDNSNDEGSHNVIEDDEKTSSADESSSHSSLD